MMTIIDESYLHKTSKRPIDKRILERSRSVMMNNLGSFLNSDPSTWEEDEEVDDETRILKLNPIRGSESRIITEIPMYNLKTLGSVLHKRKLTKEEVSQRVSQFRKTVLGVEAQDEGGGEDGLRKSSVGTTVTWDHSLEFEDCNNSQSSTVDDLEWEWYNDELDQDCMETCLNEKRNGCTHPTEKMRFDDEEICGDYPPTDFCDYDEWLIEPSDDGVSLPV